MKRRYLLIMLFTASVAFALNTATTGGAELHHKELPAGETPTSLNISWENATYEDKTVETYETDGYCKLAKKTYRILCIPKKKAPATYTDPFTIRFSEAGKVNGKEVDVLCKIDKIYLYPEWRGISYTGSAALGKTWINVSYSKNGYDKGLYAFGDENGHNKFHYDVKKYFDCSFSIVEKGTCRPVPCKYFIAGYDIDWYYDSDYEEYMEFDHSSFEDIYTYKGCFLSSSNSGEMQKYYVRTYNEQGLVEGTASWYKAGVIGVTPQNATKAKARITVCNSNIPILLGAVTQNPPEKKVDKAICQPGDTITYTIVQKNGTYVKNTFKPYSQLAIEDVLPEGITYQSAVMYSGDEDVTHTAGILSYDQETRTLSYTFSDSWRSNMTNYRGQELKLKIKVKADETKKMEHLITNSCKGSIDGITYGSNSVETTIVRPELTIEKTAEGGQEGSSTQLFYTGGQVTYKIRVGLKAKGTEAKNVVISDELPEGIALKGVPRLCGAEGRITAEGQKITCTIPVLKEEDMAVLSISAEVGKTSLETLKNTSTALCENGDTVSSYADIIIGKARPTKVNLGVMHTERWQRNLDHYNSVVSEEKRRSQNTFWSGEYFVIVSQMAYDSSNIDPSTLPESAYILGESDDSGKEYRVNFDSKYEICPSEDGRYIVRQEAVLWDKSMFLRWGGNEPKNLIICCRYRNKDLVPDKRIEVIIDNRKDYYMLHRKK
ncbi:MAG: isopeptide-forming domain-containing fimbrial protein [Clostridiales bacterium]|nr:isopeptide-forming domain-containing fimbrial protein [Clostridiales bacterium]